jgi:quercetin dioxygenase-like cupin family protein
MYVVRNTFPAGRIGTPHFHDQDRYITVLKGTWWVSLGPESDSGDPNKMIPMKAGSYVFHPANGHHFDGTKNEEAMVQIIGMGPVTTTRVKSTGGTAQR